MAGQKPREMPRGLFLPLYLMHLLRASEGLSRIQPSNFLGRFDDLPPWDAQICHYPRASAKNVQLYAIPLYVIFPNHQRVGVCRTATPFEVSAGCLVDH